MFLEDWNGIFGKTCMIEHHLLLQRRAELCVSRNLAAPCLQRRGQTWRRVKTVCLSFLMLTFVLLCTYCTCVVTLPWKSQEFCFLSPPQRRHVTTVSRKHQVNQSLVLVDQREDRHCGSINLIGAVCSWTELTWSCRDVLLGSYFFVKCLKLS